MTCIAEHRLLPIAAYPLLQQSISCCCVAGALPLSLALPGPPKLKFSGLYRCTRSRKSLKRAVADSPKAGPCDVQVEDNIAHCQRQSACETCALRTPCHIA